MGTHEQGIEATASRFRQRFGRPPALVASVPGRVNLIGEHTDYNGLPVLPIAIDRRLLVAAAPRDDAVMRLASAGAFPAAEYDASQALAPAAGDWANYHRAATWGLRALLGRDGLRGGDFLVDSTIPARAGLSSSSALVVGSALALLGLNGIEVPPAALAELLAAAERFVGTQSGGMDQAICLLGEAGRALRIDFDPLRTHPVPIPAGAAFVVCHSLVGADKSGPAQAAYNRRVLECRLACRVLERALVPSLPRPLVHIGDLARLFPDRPLSEFVDSLDSLLPPRPLTLAEIARVVGTSVERLSSSVGAAGIGAGEPLALGRRARHVLTEAERVERAEGALAGGDWLALAALMDASHASCRDDYEVSCAELEALIAAAKDAGALGSRLTGAGFGGCTVHLLDAAEASLFCTLMERGHYRKLRPPPETEYCFAVTASPGATVVEL